MAVNGKQAIRIPKPGSTVKYEKKLDVPFAIYADFEAITEKISSFTQYNWKSHSDAYQKHTSCGYGYTLVYCYDNKYSKSAQLYAAKTQFTNFGRRYLRRLSPAKK